MKKNENLSFRSNLFCHWQMCMFTVAVLTLYNLPSVFGQHGCEPEAQFHVRITNDQVLVDAAMPDFGTGASYSWSSTGLGGATSTNTSMAVSLPAGEGAFTVRLNATNDFVNAACEKTFEISTRCDTAQFTWVIDVENCLVSFTPSVLNVASHHWSFGDGSTSSEAAPTHLYAQSGWYQITHTVTQIGPDGQIFIFTCQHWVNVVCNGGGGGGCCGGGSFDPTECCRLKFCFIHPIQDINATYFWDFGDGETSTEMNPCHYYDNISTYPVAQGGTPTVTVQRCITPFGGSQICVTIVVNLVGTAFPAAIYVGKPLETTSINVVSSINGAPLFPGNTMTGPKEVHVMGELELEKSFTFRDDINFCMDPCAGMMVNTNKLLRFDNNVVVKNKCCLWRSIDLDYQSGFQSTNNNIIEGAQYGLRTIAKGSRVHLSDTKFLKNWVGIFARHPFQLVKFDRNLFESLTTDPHCLPFSCDQELSALIQIPHIERGFAGIVGRKAILNMPTSGVFPSALDNNLFRGMDNGIWLHDSDAIIRRCDFLNIRDLAYGQKSGNGIRFNVTSGTRSLEHLGDNTVFSSTSTGVRVETAAGGMDNSHVESRKNTMDVNKYGYRLEIGGTLSPTSVIRDNLVNSYLYGVDVSVKNAEGNSIHLDVTENEVVIQDPGNTGVGILVNNALPPVLNIFSHDINVFENDVVLNSGRAGIEVRNFIGADVSENDILIAYQGGGNSPPFPPFGIYTNGGKKNRIQCNKVTGTATFSAQQHALVTEASHDNLLSGNTLKTTRIGIEFRGICGSLTNLKCNSMESHDVGLRYLQGARTGDQFIKGNKWLGSNFGTGAWHMGTTSSDLNGCRFRAKLGTTWPPSITAPFGQPEWFTIDNSYVNCFTTCPETSIPDDTSSMDITIATIGYSMPNNEAVYNWDARRYLYGKLSANPALIGQSGTFYHFMANQSGTSIGLLNSAAGQLQGLYAVPSLEQQSFLANAATIALYRDSIAHIDALLASGTLSEAQETALVVVRETLMDGFATLQANSGQLQAQWLANRSVAANPVIGFNSSIVPSGQHDQNEKNLIDIFLRTEAKRLPLNLAQKAQVGGIAGLCPEVGGYAVYWARAWYYTLTGELVFPQGCLDTQERSGSDQEAGKYQFDTVGLFTVSPNPAQNTVSITLSQPVPKGGGIISLVGLSGQMVIEHELLPGNTEADLSLAGVPDGIYLVGLWLEGQGRVMQKLVVMR